MNGSAGLSPNSWLLIIISVEQPCSVNKRHAAADQEAVKSTSWPSFIFLLNLSHGTRGPCNLNMLVSSHHTEAASRALASLCQKPSWQPAKLADCCTVKNSEEVCLLCMAAA